MTMTLLYLLAFVLVLSLVVIVHEGGHFVVARLCGVKVTEFSLGFGKKLFSKTDKHGTAWQIRLIPLGGYVKMLGDEDAASTKSSDKDVPEEDKDKHITQTAITIRPLPQGVMHRSPDGGSPQHQQQNGHPRKELSETAIDHQQAAQAASRSD